MDLSGQRRSNNVEDRRGGMGGLGGGAPGGRRLALGLGGTIAVVVVGTLLGADPQQLLSALSTPTGPVTDQTLGPSAGANDTGKDFVAGVLGSTEDVWSALFQASGSQYPQPKLVLFRNLVQSACGRATSATGPFYCPGDDKVYLDLSFFDELARRFKAPGDFAQAYVIAHEVGHHIQNVTGVERKVRKAQRGQDEAAQNALSVKMELQADCYAGVWANHAQSSRPFLQEGDIEEALAAATAIGDDRLQQQAQGHVVPESFTHGSSAQRVKWFSKGMKLGSIEACDTFSSSERVP
jgi:predicted metalloprotease